MKGDAPTDSERTAYEITHLQHSGARPAHWDVTANHFTSDSVGTSPAPIIAMDIAMRRARADDAEVDDDLRTFLAIVEHSMNASDSVRDKKSHRLHCKLSGRLLEKPV